MQLLNILEEKYSLIISLLGPTVVLYIFPLERRREAGIGRGKAGEAADLVCWLLTSPGASSRLFPVLLS